MVYTVEEIKAAARVASEKLCHEVNLILLNKADYTAFMRSIGESERTIAYDVGGVFVAESDTVKEGCFSATYGELFISESDSIHRNDLEMSEKPAN